MPFIGVSIGYGHDVFIAEIEDAGQQFGADAVPFAQARVHADGQCVFGHM